MATTDTNVSQVVVNKLTKAQYTAATKSPTEFYAVTDEKISESDIDWSTFGNQSSYIDLGTIRICFGSFTITGIPTGNYGEKAQAITYPAAFASAPMVFAQPGDMAGGCGEYVAAAGVSATGATLWCGHTGSTSATVMSVSWLAIGTKA